jgi:hypothetical protein
MCRRFHGVVLNPEKRDRTNLDVCDQEESDDFLALLQESCLITLLSRVIHLAVQGGHCSIHTAAGAQTTQQCLMLATAKFQQYI